MTLSCTHVQDGAEVAGFVTVGVHIGQSSTEAPVDICAECLKNVRSSTDTLSISGDRRQRGRK